MMHWGEYGLGWGMGFGGVLMVVSWILVILGIVYLVKSFAGGRKGAVKEETALDILKRRYARGELSKEEFERMKEDLNKH
jgi:putative membrane protein